MKAVVLLSGGMDSTTLLHYVIQNLDYEGVYALTIHYGQKHQREIDAARWQTDHLAGVLDWHLLDVSVIAHLLTGASALTDDRIDVPALKNLSDDQLDQPPTYVPNRNMIMLSLAAAYAESRHCRDIFYGAQAQDEYGYWDCTADFVDRLNHVCALNRREPVKIHAPFAGMSKAEELRLGLELGVDYAHTWTCYRGGQSPCGECPTCIERQHAFDEAGVTDPLPAASPASPKKRT